MEVYIYIYIYIYISGVQADSLFILAICFTLVSCLAVSTLKMEVMRSTETSVHIQTTRCYISECGNIHIYRCENLNSYMIFDVH
jgi:hypothetical protein